MLLLMNFIYLLMVNFCKILFNYILIDSHNKPLNKIEMKENLIKFIVKYIKFKLKIKLGTKKNNFK